MHSFLMSVRADDDGVPTERSESGCFAPAHRHGADAAVELWPWEPDPLPDADPDGAGQIPPGGRFAETMGEPEP